MKCYSDVDVVSTKVPEDAFNTIEIPTEE
jgi:hypothetical protein